MYYRKIGKLGGSLYVGIPSKLRDELGLFVGDYVQVELCSYGIIINKCKGFAVVGKVQKENKRLRGEISHG